MTKIVLKVYIYLFISMCIIENISAEDENEEYSIAYTSETFVQEVPKNNHFVMFYAPWCGHCKRLHPTWEKLAEMLNIQDSTVTIGKVDCTTNTGICSKHDVTGYPTLKYFAKGSEEGVKYRGTRDIPSLSAFINSQLDEPIILEANNAEDKKAGVESPLPEPVNGLTELTEDTFEKYVASGKHFIKFYAPWCGHCQKLAPTWEELAQSLEHDSSIRISKVDCTLHRPVCNLFEVKGYPTLLFIEDGKKVDKYQGSRTHDSLKEYVLKMATAQDNDDGKSNDDDDTKSDNEINSKQTPPVLLLTGANFEHGIENDVTFVKFFAPWCGHCKRLSPTWDELALKFIKNSKVSIAKVDCTEGDNKSLCSEQEVDGFPTIFIYKNGQKMAEYTGSRSLDDLHSFVTKYLEDHDEL